MKLQPACSRPRLAPLRNGAQCNVPRRAAARPRASTQHVRWASEVAMLPDTPNMEVLIKVLQAQGQKLVSPEDRTGLHPLLIPLTQGPDAQVTCLLRWPEPRTHKDITLPVVSMSRNAATLSMLARSSEEYLHRSLASEDSTEGGPGAVAAAAGSVGAGLYEPGTFKSSKAANLDIYLTQKVGMFPDVAESLALRHWDKGDSMSALITAEWYIRRLPGWGRPFEFAYQLMQRAGRPEESRDTARVGLRQPWWTFQEGFAGLRDAAGMSGGAAAIREALEEQDNMSNGEVLRGMYKTNPKTDKQIQMDEAEWLMNRAAAGEVSWDDIREGLAEAYARAGLTAVSHFIQAP